MQDYGHIRRMYLVDGLSQRQIAEKLGISRNTVAKYCEGNTYPGLRASYCRAASVMTPVSHQVAGKPHPVAHLLQEERQALLPLPGRPYDVRRTEVCRISLQATVRFQGNAYSVPVQYAGQEAALKAGAEDICIYVDGKAVAEHVRAYGHGTEVLELAHYLPLLERKPRSILQARPVQQALSPRLLHLLQTHAFSAKDLMDILRLCVEKGESCFWRKEAQFLARPLHKDAIKDAVVVKAVDLAAYDHFLEGGEEPCRMQA